MNPDSSVSRPANGTLPASAAHRRPGRRAYLLIALFALFLVLLPFLFWYDTWFGRPLSDAALDVYFHDASKPRHAQQALAQLGERISHGQNVSRWYPNVMEQASSPNPELRQTAAWIMGQDPHYQPFHEALLKLIHDPEPMVRRNAALALCVFRDAAARPELIAMLRPYTIASPETGVLKYRLKLGDYVNPGTLIGRIGEAEVRSAVPGEVRELSRRDGATVKTGDPLADLSPDKNHVWEALRGLYLVGQSQDLDDVRRYERPVPGMPDTVERQAQSTAEAIGARRE